nr:ankyrin repeat domain-containing protein 37 isoform X2 [Paramormyrops kingsleyae]
MDCLGMLVAAGSAVNSTGDESGQSPAHLAACGGHALCLLWLLHTGADANQQDAFGETPVHKAARAGSVECITVLVASEAKLGICNLEGKTAEDLAWEAGWEKCGRLLETVRVSRQVGGPKGDGDGGCRVSTGLKRAGESLRGQYGKRARDW